MTDDELNARLDEWRTGEDGLGSAGNGVAQAVLLAIGEDAWSGPGAVLQEIRALRQEVQSLREEIAALHRENAARTAPRPATIKGYPLLPFASPDDALPFLQ